MPQRPIRKALARPQAATMSISSRVAPPEAQPTRHPLPPAPAQAPRVRLPRRAPRKLRSGWMTWLMIGAPLGLLAMLLLIGILGAALVLGGDTALAGVSIAGIPVGGLNEEAATIEIAQTWEVRGVLLRDGEQVYPVQPTLLGISLDAQASAQRAVEYRRGSNIGGLMRAVLDEVILPPVISLDREAFARGLAEIAMQINRPAQNAGVEFVSGTLQARPAQEGRAIDIGATLTELEALGTQALRDGALDLVMQPIAPTVTDATPILAAAQSLLASPFDIALFNPVRNTSSTWQVMPDIWASWLTAISDAAQPSRLALTFDTNALRGYLESQGDALDKDEYLNMDETLATINDAIARSETRAQVRIYNRDATHVVQAGETITSIAWDYGVPYLYIQGANGGLADGLSVGDSIIIPSADSFLELPVVPNKRIVVNIGEQRVRVYEDGALRWDWVASTGIASSPTWTGIYQIISHEPNAYAGNWDLWMPDFMGVYRPIPGADFTNGFHGFPTRGGSQLLWTNSLGTRVTYGCILLSNENIRLLYDWAEQGVVVEIRA